MKIYDYENNEFNTIAWVKAMLNFNFEEFKEKYCKPGGRKEISVYLFNLIMSELENGTFKIDPFLCPKSFDYLKYFDYATLEEIFYTFRYYAPIFFFKNEIHVEEDEKKELIEKFFDKDLDKDIFDFRVRESALNIIFRNRYSKNIIINPYVFTNEIFKKKIKKQIKTMNVPDYQIFKKFILSNSSLLKIISPDDYEFYRELFYSKDIYEVLV
ncbi:MAG: hypothetical protein QXW35_04415 [Candidatus Aenigmatarchaeota archaeon]